MKCQKNNFHLQQKKTHTQTAERRDVKRGIKNKCEYSNIAYGC